MHDLSLLTNFFGLLLPSIRKSLINREHKARWCLRLQPIKMSSSTEFTEALVVEGRNYPGFLHVPGS